MTPEDTLWIRMGAQRVRRYHTADIIGSQTVADHTYGAVQILRYLIADKPSTHKLLAMEHMLDHDVAELETGDIPFPAKLGFPTIKAASRVAEVAIGQAYNLSEAVTPEIAKDCKEADLLEMAHFGFAQFKKGSSYGVEIIARIRAALEAREPSAKAESFISMIEDNVGITYVSE